jgi:drug/metabolite transporter (DMT)-like permease
MRASEWGWLLLLSLLWGGSFLFVELALRDLPVLTVALGRMGIAAALLVSLVVAMRLPLAPLIGRWREFLLLGALRGAIPVCLIVWAQTRIDSSVAGILNSTSSFFTMAIAHLLTRDDRLTPQKALGCAIGIAGVALMIGLEAVREMRHGVVGQLAMFGATLSYGFAAVCGRRFEGMPHTSSAAGMLCGATLLILPLALVLERPWALNPGLQSLAGLLALAILSTAAALVVWFRLIASVGPSNTSLVTFLIPIVALALGATVLGERLAAGSLIGMIAILAGLAVTQFNPQARAGRAPL